jgi:uncharacterized protein
MTTQGTPGPGQYQQPFQTPQGAPASPSKEETNWAVFCHLAAFAFFVVPPFGHVLGPLVIWLVKKDTLPFVDLHGKDAVNFQISMTIYAIVSMFLVIVLIGIPLLAAVLVADFVLAVIAAMAASRGEKYKYPFTITFIR